MSATAFLGNVMRTIISERSSAISTCSGIRVADYAEAMWLALQADAGDDYVIGAGQSYSIRDFCEMAFAHVGQGLARPCGGRSRAAAADRFPRHGGAAGEGRASARLAAAHAVQDTGRHAGRRPRRGAVPRDGASIPSAPGPTHDVLCRTARWGFDFILGSMRSVNSTLRESWVGGHEADAKQSTMLRKRTHKKPSK